jgi:hypothetical protein
VGLQFEFHEVADLPGLEQLWRDATDWGDETLHQLHDWFMEAPFGKPRIVVARDSDSGEVVGQFRFMPSRVVVNGRELRAHRPFGTIISKRMRNLITSNNPLDQPAVAMYVRAMHELQARKEQLIYMVPDPRWVRMFKMFPFFQTGSFPLWSLQLPLPKGPLSLGDGFVAAPFASWDDGRLRELWKAAQQLHGCMAVRDVDILRWRLANATYTVTVVEKGRELVGFVASRHKGDRQWLICDLLAADRESMRATLAAAANVAHQESLTRTGAEEIHKVAVLATPLMEPVVGELGFIRDSYDFPLAVHILDDSVRAEDVHPSRWYVSAND